jgi:hypothetical protein
MNTLEHYVRVRKLNADSIMDQLQDNGVISDECIKPYDVIDSGKAVAWLERMDIGKVSLDLCEKKFDF